VWVYFFREQAERFDIATGTFILLPGRYAGDGGSSFYVNTRGFVGAEFQEPVSPENIRIVTLGDSCTFGGGTDRDTYGGQLEIHLHRIDHTRRYQVINAGIRGLNTEFALRRLVTKVLPLGPDILTVYLGWNDLMKLEPRGQAEKPGTAIVARLLDRLWLIKGMRKLIFYYLRPLVSAPITGPASRSGKFRDYRPAVFEENLRRIIQAARDQGTTVVVMTLPSVVSDNMSLDDLHRLNVIFPYFQSAYSVGDFVDLIAAYNRSIRATVAREAMLVDLATEIADRADRRYLFFDTMHPNQAGRVVIAEILARHISVGFNSGHDSFELSRSRAQRPPKSVSVK
jgi:lysophospholipase L1-like esterase